MLAGTVGSAQPSQSQSCPGYSECITISYGSPFKQQWCISKNGLTFNSSKCDASGGAWQWRAQVHRLDPRHTPYGGIKGSFVPNPGDPTAMTMTQTLKHKSSNGTIIYAAVLWSCIPFSGGFGCDGPGNIGIAIK
jgi:hypothetical protein